VKTPSRVAAVLLAALTGGFGSLAAQQPAFEVASVKPNKSGPGSLQRVGLPPGDRVSLMNVPVRTLILVAYPDIFDIVGSPAWIGVPGPNFHFDAIAVLVIDHVEHPTED